jgi:hypothetical protein
MNKRLSLALALAAAACFSVSPLAAQQTKPTAKPAPEKKEHPMEHPAEHPGSGNKVSTDDIDKAIRAHIEKISGASHGSFPVKDDVLKKTWELKLDRVHNDKLQALADGRYFACVDFKAADGTMVDVDFFMKKEGEGLAVIDTTVHKVNGKARYGYEEKDGVWVRVAEKS